MEILAAKAVSRYWSELINDSKPLKEATFQLPQDNLIGLPEDSPGRYDVSNGQIPPYAWESLRINPIFEESSAIRFDFEDLQDPFPARRIEGTCNGTHTSDTHYMMHWAWGFDGECG